MSLKPHYSVLIIGAGINGCGTFRDLCLQGIDCLLIDKADVCGGASAAPSRLIHGGLRYLETKQFRLVKESAMERNRMLKNAPHYVKPLETVFPSRSWTEGLMSGAMSYLGFGHIKKRGALLIEIGLRIYDFYNRKVQVLPNHQFFGKSKLTAEHPDLDTSFIAAGVYHEARVTHAERLGLEQVLDGIAANPASALRTYTSVNGTPQSGKLTLKDEITGETQSVSADVIINAGGAWIDKVNASMGINSEYMGGSRGAHVIVNNQKLVKALNGRMIYFGCKDGRFNLVYPFFGNALVGSTDIPQKDPDLAHCSTEEADYLLSAVGEVFPDIKLTRDDVILTYCGVRPLPRSEGVDIGTVTRDHAIAHNKLPGTDVPVLSLIGGKWTTHRAFSEQATDEILVLLKKPRKMSTETLPIGGGRDYPSTTTAQESFIASLGERGRILFDRYGTTASAMAAAGGQAIRSLPGYSTGEITHICKHENVRRLADLLLRRTAIAMEGLMSQEAIRETAPLAASALGWDAARVAQEIAHAETEMAKRSIWNTKPAKAA
jgi:glycerol-3-phosphate dehydrogenase